MNTAQIIASARPVETGLVREGRDYWARVRNGGMGLYYSHPQHGTVARNLDGTGDRRWTGFSCTAGRIYGRSMREVMRNLASAR